MLNLFQSLFLAATQGISELFPISSVGHIALIPGLLGWHINGTDESYLAFVVIIHVGTAFALLGVYYKEWIKIIRSLIAWMLRGGKRSKDYYEHLGLLVIVGTIPVGLLGLIFKKKIEGLILSPYLIAYFLILNGFILLIGEIIKKRNFARKTIPLIDFSLKKGFVVGIVQSLALIPGISRSGSSMVGGIAQGLDHEDSANYSFMLAAPIILLAGLLEAKIFLHSSGMFVTYMLSSIVAGIFALFSIKFLIKYFKVGDLMPFAYYCFVIGLFSIFVFKVIYK